MTNSEQMKKYDVLNELVSKTQELHRAIFDKGYEQGQKDILEQLNGKDYISREETLMALTGDITDCTIEEYIARLRNKLSKLPSVNNNIKVTINED